MKNIFFLLGIFSIFLFSLTVNASWWCGGQEWNDCSSPFTQGCCPRGVTICIMPNANCGQYCCSGSCSDYTQFRFCDNGWNACCIGDVSVCINPNQDCSQRCCIPGTSCNSWDNYHFCDKGSTAYCGTNVNWPDKMLCCPSDYPIVNPAKTACWKNGWECTMNSECQPSKSCVANKCVCIPNNKCGEWGSCINGQQTRTCDDGCGITRTETQACCVPTSLQCSEWSSCVSNTETRTCSDSCSPPQTQKRSCCWTLVNNQCIESNDCPAGCGSSSNCFLTAGDCSNMVKTCEDYNYSSQILSPSEYKCNSISMQNIVCYECIKLSFIEKVGQFFSNIWNNIIGWFKT